MVSKIEEKYNQEMRKNSVAKLKQGATFFFVGVSLTIITFIWTMENNITYYWLGFLIISFFGLVQMIKEAYNLITRNQEFL